MYAALVNLPLLSTSTQLKAVKQFFASGGLGASAPELVKARLLGRIRDEVDWVSKYEAGLCSSLASGG